MSMSDGTMHSSEEQVILNKMMKLFPSESDYKMKLGMAFAEYKALDSAMTMNVIRESFLFFDKVTFAQKYKVYADMYDIVNADGKVEEPEKKALTDLKEIIDMNMQK
jgi:hypothetical protein